MSFFFSSLELFCLTPGMRYKSTHLIAIYAFFFFIVLGGRVGDPNYKRENI